MRLAYLSASAVPSLDANAVHVMKMCAAFTAEGTDVTLYTLPGVVDADPHSFYGIGGFGIRSIRRPRLPAVGDWIRAARIAWNVRSARPDVVYGRDLRSTLLASIALPDCPVVYEAHLVPTSRRRRRLEHRLARRRNLRSIVVITEALRADLSAAIRPEAPVVVAPDGADPASTGPMVDLPGGWCSNVGYVGHLYAGRGIEVLLDVASQMPDVGFHFVGGRADDVARLREHGLPANVVLHGHVSPSQVPGFLRSFDVLVAPYQRTVTVSGGADTSRWMSPLKVFEYLASGVPLVASDLPVLREVLHDDRNALLCPPSDTAAWSAAIRRLLDEPALGRRLSAAGVADIEARYSWRVRARRVLAAATG